MLSDHRGNGFSNGTAALVPTLIRLHNSPEKHTFLMILDF
jgi:hypothetical protein